MAKNQAPDRKQIIDDLKKSMEGALTNLHHNLGGLRTGRASASMLDPIMVEAYGSFMPISQVGTVNVPEAKLITVQVWEKTLVKAVEKAIANSNLGVSPSSDGQLVRIPLPPLSEERRKELAKVAAKYGEDSKVSIRNKRRDINDLLKKLEKNKDMSEDDHKKIAEEVQKIVDDYTKKIDQAVVVKEKEILGG